MRTNRGFSQAGLAELAGVDRKTINRIENGHFSPSLDTLTRLSVVLKCRLADFLKSPSASRRVTVNDGTPATADDAHTDRHFSERPTTIARGTCGIHHERPYLTGVMT